MTGQDHQRDAVREVVERYRTILDGLEPQGDEPEALDELVRELGDWAPLRARATRMLLGESIRNGA